MSKFFLPTRHEPASGVAPRPVPGLMAPERCVQYGQSLSESHAVLLGYDTAGVLRIKVEIAKDDLSSWWVKVIRHWLAWACGSSEIKIVR